MKEHIRSSYRCFTSEIYGSLNVLMPFCLKTNPRDVDLQRWQADDGLAGDDDCQPAAMDLGIVVDRGSPNHSMQPLHTKY